MKTKLITFSLLATLAPALHAATVITPVGATATTGIGATDDRHLLTQAINASGLSDVSDPSSELDDLHTSGYGTDYWMSLNGSPAAGGEVLEFNLGTGYDINGLYYWKYNRTTNRSMKTFDISYSTNGGTDWTTPVSALSLGMADWTIGADTRDATPVDSRTFNTTLVGVTDIRFSNLENYGGTYYTLAEIRFSEAIPEPSTSALLGLAGLALILRRRK